MDTHLDSPHSASFWRKYVFSIDHKWIGIQYGITALLFLLFGFILMLLMRWQLAYPERPLPFFAGIDWLLFQRVASMIICYRCGGEFREFLVPARLQPYLHKIGLRYDRTRLSNS